MYTNNGVNKAKKTDQADENFSWKEYGYYHDYFVELLSYNKKSNYTHSNIWEFCYLS